MYMYGYTVCVCLYCVCAVGTFSQHDVTSLSKLYAPFIKYIISVIMHDENLVTDFFLSLK